MSKRRKRRARRAFPVRPLLAIVAALILAVVFFWRPALRAPRPHAARPAPAATVAFTTPEPAGTPVAPPTPARIARRAPPPPPDESRYDPDVAASATGARLAIVIDDCGQHLDLERRFTTLGVPLTLSVLPHVRYAAAIAQAAADRGAGVMLHLPMENRAGYNPGPGTITTAMDDAAIATQVRDDLDAVPLATGVNNHEGSRATADARVMRDVAGVLADRHRFFLDSRTTAATVAERETRAAGVPTARRDVFLDDVDDRAAIEAQLRRAADIAREQGSAVAIGHPRAATYAAVAALVPEFARDGVTLVRVAELTR